MNVTGMKKAIVKLVAAAAVIAATGFAGAVRADETKKGEAAARLERIKKLAGEWTLGDGKTAFVYKVVAGGSAVMEHLFPGTDHEMITMYHLDGDELVLTHYCGAGNQPRMKAKKGGDAKIEFAFAGGSNLDATKDGHMHDMTLTFKDEDHIVSEWQFWKGGAKADGKTFALSRIKAEAAPKK